MDASSEWGVGSRFAFVLPQKVITDPHVTETLTSDMVYAAMFRTHDAKVLLVDDNELNREVVKAILEPMQLTIDEAANGLEAVHMANTTLYDMIFMDSHMPVMNGNPQHPRDEGLHQPEHTDHSHHGRRHSWRSGTSDERRHE